MSPLIRLLQLASPALPIGGYSYSSGLETAIDTGRVRDADSAFAWIADAVSLVLARFDAPLLAAAVHAASDGDRMRLADLNRMALAARETAELRLESEQAGYSLGRWIAEVAGQQGGQAEGADEADEADGAEDRQARADDATVSGDDPGRVAAIVSLAAGVGRPLSAPVGWGLACASVGLPPRDAVTAYLWSFAENQAAVLLKAMPLGQAGAQRLLLRLGPVVAAAIDAALALPQSAWSNAAPGLAIASMRHETQYSRLFRS